MNIKSYNRDEAKRLLNHMNAHISANDFITGEMDEIKNYLFQLSYELSQDELSHPYEVVDSLYEALPLCMKSAKVTVVLLEKNDQIKLPIKLISSIGARVKHHSPDTTIYSREHDTFITGGRITIYFFGVPVNVLNMEELESFPMMSTCANEQVRKKRLASLFQ